MVKPYYMNPVDTPTSLQTCCDVSLTDVTLTLPLSCNGNAGRCCKNSVVATSHKETETL